MLFSICVSAAHASARPPSVNKKESTTEKKLFPNPWAESVPDLNCDKSY